ncbi:hypothetical protein UFOVP138_34 [uncultured Caudovirales phage]|uniref:Uncharacterized protein n=1 Tax=uncultured Caudovirales phage TaxID=2100421 RepID=A0A6J5LCU2_9CAUD|nr:hypothetical protein UFOVP138_34 [uncultured Caudovirales phage]
MLLQTEAMLEAAKRADVSERLLLHREIYAAMLSAAKGAIVRIKMWFLVWRKKSGDVITLACAFTRKDLVSRAELDCLMSWAEIKKHGGFAVKCWVDSEGA